MTLEELLAEYHNRLNKDPTDWQTRLDLAAVLEEEVEDLAGARAQIYMAVYKKHPSYTVMISGAKFWVWGSEGRMASYKGGLHRLLPESVYGVMRNPNSPEFTSIHWWYFKTRQEAENALAEALANTAGGVT